MGALVASSTSAALKNGVMAHVKHKVETRGFGCFAVLALENSWDGDPVQNRSPLYMLQFASQPLESHIENENMVSQD